MKQLLKTHDDYCEFAQRMTAWHLEQARNWTQGLMKECTLHEREVILRDFKRQCETALYQLKGLSV